MAFGEIFLMGYGIKSQVGKSSSILSARVANHSSKFNSSCPLMELAIKERAIPITYLHSPMQYRSKVSWQSLEPRALILESGGLSLESWVSSCESRKIMSLSLDWSLENLIAQTGHKPNMCTCRLRVLRAIVLLTLETETNNLPSCVWPIQL